MLDLGTLIIDAMSRIAKQDLNDRDIKQLLLNAKARLTVLAQSTSDREPTHTLKMPTLDAGTVAQPYVFCVGDVARADSRQLLKNDLRHLADNVRQVEDPMSLKLKTIQAKESIAGTDWFNPPRTVLTPALKHDLQLLKMRDVWNPKQHFKKEISKATASKFSQIGTIIEGPTEFYSARIRNKDRKQTFADEIAAGELLSGWFNKRYRDVQYTKTSGRKAHYKTLHAKRSHGIRK